MLPLLFRIVVFVWPFLWELVMGKVTVRQALKNNKKKVFIVIIVMLSFLLNIWLMYRVYYYATREASNKTQECVTKELVLHSPEASRPSQNYNNNPKKSINFLHDKLDEIARLEGSL